MNTNLPPKFPWTDEMVERATHLRTMGASASQIAAALDPTGQLTRNAIIGKFQRLDGKVDSRGQRKNPKPREPSPPKAIKPRPTDIKPKLNRLTPRDIQLVSPPTPAPREPEIVLKPKIETTGNIFTHLQSQCSYPVRGEGINTFFCESPKVRGSYCEHHASRCYIEPIKGKGRAA